MLNLLRHTLPVVCLFVINLPVWAQWVKPKVYIDPKGIRYSQQQFDSIRTANTGKPIAQMDVIQKENETQITFEVLAVNPNDLFKAKWIGKLLPTFSLKDIQGNTYSNSSLKGKLIVINFWSTTCVPCIKEMPLLSDLMAKYRGRNIVFIAPAPESALQIQKLLARHRFTYTILPQAQTLFSALTIEGYPYHFIISPTGIIEDIYTGSSFNPQTNEAILDNRLVAAIDKALENH
ncbi:TlpA family protein disulfide reductase [Spirosoma sp.]|uniref:TlpA family protein disulfide reductase n=1 Tax=Spirosoma sp. TaxID=1899569 RepID=UPI003B3AE35F